MTKPTDTSLKADNKPTENLPINGSDYYEITVKGYVDESWADWFGKLSVSYDVCGFTTFSGSIADQAALHGILAQIRDLALPLVSLKRLDSRTQEQS